MKKIILIRLTILTIVTLLLFSCSSSLSEDKEKLRPFSDTGTLRHYFKRTTFLKEDLKVNGVAPVYNVQKVSLIYDVIDNEKVRVVSTLLIPETSDELKGVLIYYHGTTIDSLDIKVGCPNGDFDFCELAKVAANGYAVLFPHYVGLGDGETYDASIGLNTKNFHQRWTIPENVQAEFIALMDVFGDYAFLEKVTVKDQKLYLAGHSQGGANTVISHLTYQSLSKVKLDLVGSFASSGPYDHSFHLNYYLGDSFSREFGDNVQLQGTKNVLKTTFIPLLIYSWNHFYGNFYEESTELFNPIFAPPKDLGGIKRDNFTFINLAISKQAQVSLFSGTFDIRFFWKDIATYQQFYEQTTTTLDGTSKISDFIFSKSPINISSSNTIPLRAGFTRNDEFVPFENAEKLQEKFSNVDIVDFKTSNACKVIFESHQEAQGCLFLTMMDYFEQLP